MPKITYIENDGTEHVVEANVGDSLMMTALDNSVPGIDGDCGGNCACATCHLYVDSPLTGSASDEESDMLAIADSVNEHSRLGCQIQVTAEMDGLVVKLPLGQH